MINIYQLLKEKKPLLIAGPCSAEGDEELVNIAIQLKMAGAHVLRAGAWKPRSRPENFGGFGAKALQWITMAGQKAEMPVMTEVACAEHTEEALKAGIDILWIGARTTVNPFLIQQIADSLRGVNIPVFVKNPVNPDVSLWQGAIERFANAGIKNLAAIHRGFSSYESNAYRNKPYWELAIELRNRMPDLPMICDPSHICGNTDIKKISQTALDLQYDGLMIEVHHNPAKALSDAQQQLTVHQYMQLLEELIVRQATPQDPVELSKLQDFRDRIDELDDEIINVLSKRMEIARFIGTYKSENNIAILQPERFREILSTRSAKGLENQLTRDFILNLFALIHKESILQQESRMNKQEVKTSKSK
ncbi:MAG: bifunctional 3-deoxy-7-phosphoheptulonate synthase/chorismate mutase type II [Bacteroidetes bacterium]|jgi:chorismate mutase|nr:bifunctional 3-deoxy-7-phosphoheptulonate synthase/chorismate mutase type II [Bacteroidota bacterium]